MNQNPHCDDRKSITNWPLINRTLLRFPNRGAIISQWEGKSSSFWPTTQIRTAIKKVLLLDHGSTWLTTESFDLADCKIIFPFIPLIAAINPSF